jgi:hypothetical protein
LRAGPALAARAVGVKILPLSSILRNKPSQIAASIFLLACLTSSPGMAQTNNNTNNTPRIFSGERSQPFSLRDWANRPCISLMTQIDQIGKSNLYEHQVMVENECTKMILVEACYKNSTTCVKVRAIPHEITEAILGYASTKAEFVVTFKEAYTQ